MCDCGLDDDFMKVNVWLVFMIMLWFFKWKKVVVLYMEVYCEWI